MLQIRDLCRLGVLLVLLVVAMLAVMATIKVDVNGKLVSFREAPRQFNGRIMVPLREMFNALGAEVDWNAANRMIIATRGDIDVQLGVGDHHVLVNGQLVNLDMPVTTIRGVIDRCSTISPPSVRRRKRHWNEMIMASSLIHWQMSCACVVHWSSWMKHTTRAPNYPSIHLPVSIPPV